MRILLTGFGPFGDIVDNPSGRIAGHFGAGGFAPHEIQAEVLPVSFRRAEARIRELLREGGFDVALMVGVAGKSSVFRLEAVAANEDTARIPDSDGRSPQSTLIVDGGEPELRTAADLPSILDALTSRGHDAAISTDAGRYVCNHVYYAALHEVAAARRSTLCVFLHVPPDDAAFGEGFDPGNVPFDRHLAISRDLLSLLAG